MTTTTTTETITNDVADDLAQRIEGRHVVTGDADPKTVAREWVSSGFRLDDAVAWMDVGCFDWRAAVELRDLGVTPDEIANLHDPRSGERLGYSVANGDLSADKAAKIARA